MELCPHGPATQPQKSRLSLATDKSTKIVIVRPMCLWTWEGVIKDTDVKWFSTLVRNLSERVRNLTELGYLVRPWISSCYLQFCNSMYDIFICYTQFHLSMSRPWFILKIFERRLYNSRRSRKLTILTLKLNCRENSTLEFFTESKSLAHYLILIPTLALSDSNEPKEK